MLPKKTHIAVGLLNFMYCLLSPEIASQQLTPRGSTKSRNGFIFNLTNPFASKTKSFSNIF